jgi:hypothetical protein
MLPSKTELRDDVSRGRCEGGVVWCGSSSVRPRSSHAFRGGVSLH